MLNCRVLRGTPGWRAGFNVDDEIIAVNGIRVLPAGWPARLEAYKDGETVRVLAARREELKTIELPIQRKPLPSWILEVRPDATKEQQANLKSWLR